MDSTGFKTWLREKLVSDNERFWHSVGAEEKARELAQRFGVDAEKAALAALIHDNAKCIPYHELLKIIEENNFPVEEEIKANHKVLHAFVGVYIAKKELGIDDEDVLNAMKFHTTGRAGMSMLEKIVYLADKLEERTRPDSYTDNINHILDETKDLDKTILFTVDITIKSLLERKLQINMETINLWNYLISQNK